jgi:hypothetical protein
MKLFSVSKWLQKHPGKTSEGWITSGEVKNNVFWRSLKVFEGLGVTKSSYEAVFSLRMTPTTPRLDSIVKKTSGEVKKQRFLKVVEVFEGLGVTKSSYEAVFSL